MNWFASELHTHTIHSDGDFTVKELCETSKSYELSCIAITDHNTMSGHCELSDMLEKNTVRVIKGIEWTTFFGHMCVLGAEKYVDWREAIPDNIDTKIAEIKKYNGVIGVAHPFAIGSPMCTGCNWKFKVYDWKNVDYIEIWSEEFPSGKVANMRAMKMWMELLDKGYKIAAAYGKDWHSLKEENLPSAVTYLGVNDVNITPDNALSALKSGRTFVTMGPTIKVCIKQNDTIFNIGDQLISGKYEIAVRVGTILRRNLWERFNLIPETISIVTNNNKVIVKKEIINVNEDMKFDIELTKGWIIIEINGKAMGKECILAVTSPFYVN